jgi:hypothetical protein
VADLPTVVVDTAAVAADSCLLPSSLSCPFIPAGLEGQSLLASAKRVHPSA